MKYPTILSAAILILTPIAWSFDLAYFASSNSTRAPLEVPGEPWRIPKNLIDRIDFTPHPGIRIYDGDARKALAVAQGDFAVITKKDPFDLIVSTSAGPCVIVTLFDEKAGVIGMVHADFLTSASLTLKRMLKRFAEQNAYPTKVYLAGGNSNHDSLKRWSDVLLAAGIVQQSFERSSAFGLSFAGELYNNNVFSDNVYPLSARRIILGELFQGLSDGQNPLLKAVMGLFTSSCSGDMLCAVEKAGRPATELYPQLEYP